MTGYSRQTSGHALYFCIFNEYEATAKNVFCKQIADLLYKKNILFFSDGSGTKNPGTGRIRVVLFRVPGKPGTRMNRTGRIRVK